MSKLFWFDTETTGVDPARNDIVQLAYIIDINGEEVECGQIAARPRDDSIIDSEALNANKLTREAIWQYPPRTQAMGSLLHVLSKYVDRYDKNDKFIMAGYNVNFDDQMLRAWFNHEADPYYGSWFMWPKLDVATFVAQWIFSKGQVLKNYKLSTVCKEFDIHFNAHDAVEDIRATKRLYESLMLEGRK